MAPRRSKFRQDRSSMVLKCLERVVRWLTRSASFLSELAVGSGDGKGSACTGGPRVLLPVLLTSLGVQASARLILGGFGT